MKNKHSPAYYLMIASFVVGGASLVIVIKDLGATNLYIVGLKGLGISAWLLFAAGLVNLMSKRT